MRDPRLWLALLVPLLSAGVYLWWVSPGSQDPATRSRRGRRWWAEQEGPEAAGRSALLLLKVLAQGERSLKTRGGIAHADVVRHFESRFKARRHG